MKPAIFAVALSCPFVGAAQTPDVGRRWFVDGAAGLSIHGTGVTTLGTSWAASVGRRVTPGIALRMIVEGAPSRSVTACQVDTAPPQTFCTSTPGAAIAALAIGVDVAPDVARGFYGSARVGLYMLGSRAGSWPGAYLGAGFAFPTPFGAVFAEAGAHAFAGARQPQPGWVLPLRLGLRWRA